MRPLPVWFETRKCPPCCPVRACFSRGLGRQGQLQELQVGPPDPSADRFGQARALCERGQSAKVNGSRAQIEKTWETRKWDKSSWHFGSPVVFGCWILRQTSRNGWNEHIQSKPHPRPQLPAWWNQEWLAGAGSLWLSNCCQTRLYGTSRSLARWKNPLLKT